MKKILALTLALAVLLAITAPALAVVVCEPAQCWTRETGYRDEVKLERWWNGNGYEVDPIGCC